MADHGAMATARAVASGGPTTNATSSSIDSKAKAVVSSEESEAMPAQRARTMAPRFGPVSPATVASASHDHTGVPARTATVRPARASRCRPMSGGIARSWPNRSASRAPIGPPNAPATVVAAATAPAIA